MNCSLTQNSRVYLTKSLESVDCSNSTSILAYDFITLSVISCIYSSSIRKLDFKSRCLCNVNHTPTKHLRSKFIENQKQKYPNLKTIFICVCSKNNLADFRCINIKQTTVADVHASTKQSEDIRNNSILDNLICCCFHNIQAFTTNRHDSLETCVTSLLDCTHCGITFHNPKLNSRIVLLDVSMASYELTWYFTLYSFLCITNKFCSFSDFNSGLCFTNNTLHSIQNILIALTVLNV